MIEKERQQSDRTLVNMARPAPAVAARPTGVDALMIALCEGTGIARDLLMPALTREIAASAAATWPTAPPAAPTPRQLGPRHGANSGGAGGGGGGGGEAHRYSQGRCCRVAASHLGRLFSRGVGGEQQQQQQLTGVGMPQAQKVIGRTKHMQQVGHNPL